MSDLDQEIGLVIIGSILFLWFIMLGCMWLSDKYWEFKSRYWKGWPLP